MPLKNKMKHCPLYNFWRCIVQYYNNSSYWWIISIANDSLRQDSYYVPLNQQIRIPQEIGPILSAFNKLNNVY